MLAVPGYLQTAFSTKTIKNGDLRVLWMMTGKRLFVQGARPDIGLMIYQNCLGQIG